VWLFFISSHTWFALPFLLLTGLLLWIERIKAANVDLAFFKINAWLGFVVFGMIIVGAIVR
jgi:4-hydroxybenzoate polyprenyltransferase